MISTTAEFESTGALLINEANPIVEQTPFTLKQSYLESNPLAMSREDKFHALLLP